MLILKTCVSQNLTKLTTTASGRNKGKTSQEKKKEEIKKKLQKKKTPLSCHQNMNMRSLDLHIKQSKLFLFNTTKYSSKN